MPGDPFYRSDAWITARRAYLRQHPDCCVRGCPKRATHVDHIVTRRSAPDRALDPTNFQAFCHSHHSEKTARFDGGAGNKVATGTVRMRGCDANGYPLDPDHRWRAGK